MNRKYMVVIVLFVTIILSIKIYSLYCGHSVRYSLIFTYDKTFLGGIWEIVSDSGFYSTKTFVDKYEKQTGSTLPAIFDEVGHTYVLCYGYTLEELFYREVDKRGPADERYSYYYARGVLRPADPQLVYVYLVEDSVKLDYNIHSSPGDYTTIVQ